MTGAGRIFVAAEDGIDTTPIRQALPAGVPVDVVALRAVEGGAHTELQAVADLVVVACADSREAAVRVVDAAVRQRDDRPVVVLYAGSPNGFMQRAFDAGAEDLLTLPQTPGDLRFALEKALARRRTGTTAAAAGALVSVLGPKGGTGKTLTSCNLAVALAQAGAAPVVVDLDLQFGDVALALGLDPVRTIYDLATAGGTLDGDKVEAYLAAHASGAKALLAPVRPDQAAAVTVPFLRQVFELLRASHDVVIVDTPPAFTPEVIATIDASSHLCVVGMLDALSLKDTKIGVETLAQMGYHVGDLTLVLNRADSSVGISLADVEHLLGRRPDVLVPSDRAIPRALTDGRPIVVAEPRSGAAAAFTELARRFADSGAPVAATPEAPPRRRGHRLLLGRAG